MNECTRHKLTRSLYKIKCQYCSRLFAPCKACQDEMELLEIGDTCHRCYTGKGLVEAREKKIKRDEDMKDTKENYDLLKQRYEKTKSQLHTLIKQYKDLKGFANNDAPQRSISENELSALKSELDVTKMNFQEMEKLFVHLDELSSNYDSLMDSKDNVGDIIIECGTKRFRAHSLILSSRSNVLKQICKQVLNDKSFRIKIDDVKPAVFKELLHYLYGGKCNVDDKNAIDIYAASEKYGLRTLKSSVEVHLLDIMNEKNALSILRVFDKYVNLKMRTKCIQHINTYFPNVVDTTQFTKLKNDNPDLVYQLYESRIQFYSDTPVNGNNNDTDDDV